MQYNKYVNIFLFLTVNLCITPLHADKPIGFVEILPDITIDESTLYDNYIVQNDDQRLFRFSNATSNIGPGNLEIIGTGIDAGNGNEYVDQVVHGTLNGESATYTRRAGEFEYHEEHNHTHFTDWTNFRLRSVIWQGEVGDFTNAIPGEIVAEGEKTSFCLVDLARIPGFTPRKPSDYQYCGTRRQGITSGWMDIYSAGLPGQSIDISNLEDGTYFFEVIVDPNNNVVESNEDNNTTMVILTFEGDQVNRALIDRFEPNNSIQKVQDRNYQLNNSPNIVVMNGSHKNPKKFKYLRNLSFSEFDQQDYFRFYMGAKGTENDFVKINRFRKVNGGNDASLPFRIELYKERRNGSTRIVREAAKIVDLTGLKKGYYIIRVFSRNNIGGYYNLKISPPQVAWAPRILLKSLQSESAVVEHGVPFLLEWEYKTPRKPAWVNIYLNTTREFNGNGVWVSAPINVDASENVWHLNTSAFEHGTYFVGIDANNGGSRTRKWFSQTLTIESHDEHE